MASADDSVIDLCDSSSEDEPEPFKPLSKGKRNVDNGDDGLSDLLGHLKVSDVRPPKSENSEELKRLPAVDALLSRKEWLMPPTAAESESVRQAMQMSNCKRKDGILLAGVDISASVTCHGLSTLRDRTMLNDEPVNAFLQLVQRRHGGDVYIFSTFFFSKLTGYSSDYSYDGVKRWAKGVKLWTKKLILVPVHRNLHWTVAAIYPSRAGHRMAYYDSLGGGDNGVFAALTRYMSDRAKDEAWEGQVSSLGTYVVSQGVPRQGDGTACGVFMTNFAERLAHAAVSAASSSKEIESYKSVIFDFSQGDIPTLRTRMAMDLLAMRMPPCS